MNVSCELWNQIFSISVDLFIFYKFSIFQFFFHFVNDIAEILVMMMGANFVKVIVFPIEEDVVSMVTARTIVTFIRFELLAITETEYLCSTHSSTLTDAKRIKRGKNVFPAFPCLSLFSSLSVICLFAAVQFFNSQMIFSCSIRHFPWEKMRGKSRVERAE